MGDGTLKFWGWYIEIFWGWYIEIFWGWYIEIFGGTVYCNTHLLVFNVPSLKIMETQHLTTIFQCIIPSVTTKNNTPPLQYIVGDKNIVVFQCAAGDFLGFWEVYWKFSSIWFGMYKSRGTLTWDSISHALNKNQTNYLTEHDSPPSPRTVYHCFYRCTVLSDDSLDELSPASIHELFFLYFLWGRGSVGTPDYDGI